jgi:hypothetical protein
MNEWALCRELRDIQGINVTLVKNNGMFFCVKWVIFRFKTILQGETKLSWQPFKNDLKNSIFFISPKILKTLIFKIYLI